MQARPRYTKGGEVSPPSPLRRVVRFSGFEADLSSGELRKHGIRIKLQVQPFQILRILLEHAGEVVTREELQKRIWPADTFVDFEHGLNNAVKKLREALGDDAGKQRFVETLSKRGYRLNPAVAAGLEEIASLHPAVPTGARVPPAKRHTVGRRKERTELAAAFESATAGRGSLVCVSGEPGIGKTTLVHDFLSDLQASGRRFGLAIGRCSQRLAGEEAYLPFLEALESLLCNDGGTRHKLRELAPSWYAQLFPLSESDPSDARLQEYVRTTTQERVKRELATFLHGVTRQEPLILFFDDVHWTDASTVDLLAHLATRFDSTRILVVVTYRPSELFLSKHPFIGVKRDLQAHAACREIDIEFLSAGDVERYVTLEFPGNCFPREFAGLVHARTEGNPLFMVDLLRYLRDRKVILKAEGDENWRLAQSLPDLSRDIPQSVSSVIERKIDQLSDRDREVLTAAAVQGYEFDSEALARALDADSVEIEEILDRLERIHAFVKRVSEDELPSGVPTVRYRFVHVLYQDALYGSLPPSRRVALSAALAHTLESFYGDRTSTIASQLAFLYETARNPERASAYFLLAAQNAQRIFANQEAITLAQHGLALLSKLPETPERARKELDLQVTLAFSLLFIRGYSVPEVQENIARARELCQHFGDTAQLFLVLFGLWIYHITKPELQEARRTAERMLEIARSANDRTLLLLAHATLGVALQHQGALTLAHKHLEEGLRYHDPAEHRRYLELYRMEPGINLLDETVRTLWMLGYPDQARRRSEETLALARAIPSPPSLALVLVHAAFLHQHLRQPDKAHEIAEECLSVCHEHGVAQERVWVMPANGWALAELGQVEKGTAQIRAALDAQLTTGGEIARPQFLAFLAEIHWHVGQAEEGLRAVEDGLAMSKRTGNSYYDAELWRLKGELLKMQDKTAEAESCFHKAIEIARQQAAKSLELRASTSLARLWQKQGKRKEAQQLLGDIYAWFTEGFDTADLREAASLLEEIS